MELELKSLAEAEGDRTVCVLLCSAFCFLDFAYNTYIFISTSHITHHTLMADASCDADVDRTPVGSAGVLGERRREVERRHYNGRMAPWRDVLS